MKVKILSITSIILLFVFLGVTTVNANNTILQLGDRNAEVLQLKLDLEKVGFKVSDNPNESFGSITEMKVKEFQQAYGLIVDGIAGPQTLAKLHEIISSPLRIGTRHNDVIQLKLDLEKAGYKVSDNPNNSFGPTTESKVKEFQEALGLHPSGIADHETLEKLQKVISGQHFITFKSGDRHPLIIQLKLDLEKVGFKVSNNPNESFGSITEQRVREFQIAYGIPASGIADQKTITELNNIVSSPLRIGQKHHDVIQLKLDLENVGFKVSDNPNETFGSTTERKVKEFQQSIGLHPSGIADKTTLYTLQEVISGNRYMTFKIGDRHPDMIQIKLQLAKVGFKVSVNPNESFGSITEQKVKAFQKAYRLPVSGVIDFDTRNTLEDIVNSPLKIGENHPDVIQLKLDLEKVGFKVSDNPNETFGSITERKVKEFQNTFGLHPSGIADQTTLYILQEVVSGNRVISFKTGDKHPSIVQLKLDLEKVGFKVSDNPNSTFGSITDRKVREFQKAYGLIVDGIAGPQTLHKLEEVSNSVLRRGVNHPDVIQLKVDLARVGYKVSDNPNSNFGPATENYVRAFQEENGLYVSGVANILTLNKINELITKGGPLLGRVIVVDPGHGGHDPGASGHGLVEKNVALDISLRLERELSNAGARVIMTRRTDTFVELDDRVNIANSANADAFISIHLNAFNKSTVGTETYWNRSFSSSDSQSLALNIQNELFPAIGTINRGVKEANFRVIRNTNVPAVLVEVAFIDNKDDAEKMKKSSNLNAAAKAIARGTIKHFTK